MGLTTIPSSTTSFLNVINYSSGGSYMHNISYVRQIYSHAQCWCCNYNSNLAHIFFETLYLYFGSVKEWWTPTNLFCGVCGFPVDCALSPSSANSNPNTLATSCIVEEKMIIFAVRMFWFFFTISISHPRYSSWLVFDVLKTVNLMLSLFGLSVELNDWHYDLTQK